MLLGQLYGGTSAVDPAREVASLAILGLVGFGLWGLTRWITNAPLRPDPWDDKTATEMLNEEAPALCHRCLEPHDESTHFCPNCGAPVGQYTNMLPYDSQLSIGHTLRIGTDGNFRRSPLTVVGFVLVGMAEYSIFGPIYVGMLLWKLFHKPQLEPPSGPATPQS
jgi:hypothetical protein